ncbi:MAG: InlB B-repeat-containing protein [Clostridiales bacterium]|jgi:uncharacterized repeat protein (TIGR02543 family)|nr:InlB B-repeat-containing protein [Clostridiales bacterium]
MTTTKGKRVKLLAALAAVCLASGMFALAGLLAPAPAKAAPPPTVYRLGRDSISATYGSAKRGSLYAFEDAVGVWSYNMTSNSWAYGVRIFNAEGGHLAENVPATAAIVLDYYQPVLKDSTHLIRIKAGDTTHQFAAGGQYYTVSRDGATVTPVSGRGDAYFLTSATSAIFSQYVVIPLASLGISAATDIDEISLAPNYTTRYEIYGAYLLDSFDGLAFSLSGAAKIWSPAADNFGLYPSDSDTTAQTNIAARFLKRGTFFMDNKVNSAGTSSADTMTAAFPAAMIGQDGNVDTATIKGMAIRAVNKINTNVAMTYAFTDASTSTLYRTDTNNRSQRIMATGSIILPNVSTYRAKDVNGDFNGIIYLPFTCAASGSIDAGQSFTDVGGAANGVFPAKLKPTFTIQVDNNTDSKEIEYELYFLTDDTTIYDNTLTGDARAAVSGMAKNFAGLDMTYTAAFTPGYECDSVKLDNDELTGQARADFLAGGKLTRTQTANSTFAVASKPIVYNADYDLGGGEYAAGESNPSTYTVEDAVTLAEPYKDGNVFMGWEDQDEHPVTALGGAVIGDRVLTAQWAAGTTRRITITPPAHGTVTANRSVVLDGGSATLTVTGYGYVLSSLKVNNVERKGEVAGGKLELTNITADLTVTAEFSQIDAYAYTGGSLFSLQNARYGTRFAEFNAVSVGTTDPDRAIGTRDGGVTADLAATDFVSGEYVAVRLANLVNTNYSYKIALQSGGTAYPMDGTYYLADKNGVVTQKTGAAAATTAYASASPNLTANVMGFYGYIVVPQTAFASASSFDGVTVYGSAWPARFNVGEIYKLSAFDGEALDLTGAVKIWTPSETAYTPYGDKQGEPITDYVGYGFMEKGDFVFSDIRPSGDDNYDSLYLTLPDAMIGADGWVDTAALGIKGLAIDVKNDNLAVFNLAVRIAGSTAADLTTTTYVLWQTSNARPNSRLFLGSGLVKSGNTVYIPAGFEGTVYIPWTADSFTNVGNGAFPTKIQPVVRLFATTRNSIDAGATYACNLSNLRFVTDDAAFQYCTIVTASANGLLEGHIGEAAIGVSSNNKARVGTTADFRVTPNAGYDVVSATYAFGDDVRAATVAADGTFSVVVTGDVVLMATYALHTYTVNYVLDGGTNGEGNPATFTYVNEVELADPAKEGCKFKGWYTSADFSGEAVTKIAKETASDVTLYAKWESENAGATAGCNGCNGASGAIFLAVALLGVLLLKKRA